MKTKQRGDGPADALTGNELFVRTRVDAPAWQTFAATLGVVAVCTGIGFLMSPRFDHANIVMVYLLGVALVSVRYGRKESFAAAILSVGLFDLCFVSPRGTFAVSDAQYLVTFSIMLVVALLISTLTLRLKEQAMASHEASIRVEREKLRSSLLSSVSHDLRTPLASIEGAASGLIGQPNLGPRAQELASTIMEESERMGRLVRNLLDMSRFEGGGVELNVDWQSLEELIGSALLRTERMFERPVKTEIPADLPLLRLDGVLVEQVFVNLLENAARHAGNAAQIEITATSTTKGVEVVVSDNGPGLPAGALETLFDKFQKRSGNGFGLGLAICRAVMVAHGGTIVARNRETGGAEFVLHFNQEGSVQK